VVFKVGSPSFWRAFFVGNKLYLWGNFTTMKKLLDHFTEKNGYRHWMKDPFNFNNRTCATNGHVLISMPCQGDYEDMSNNVQIGKVYPIPVNMKATIAVDEIRAKLKAFPLSDCFDVEEIETKCETCEGAGVVEYEFFHRKVYFKKFNCPDCNGEGVDIVEKKITNGKREYDAAQRFQIGVCVYHPDLVEKLLVAADFLGSKEISVLNQSSAKGATLFGINDVEIIMMPMYPAKNDIIAQSVTFAQWASK
jgi:hypothetical protein